MKIKTIFKKIILLFASSIILFSCKGKNDQILDYLDMKYIIKNIENDLIFYFAKKKFGKFQEIKEIIENNDKEKIKTFLKNYSFYKNSIDNIKKFYEKIDKKIYEKIYEEIKNENFQDNYLFSEKRFIQKLKNSGFDIPKTTYIKKIVPDIKPENSKDFINDLFFKENFTDKNYYGYSDYINKKIIPEIYCNYLIIDYIKEKEKNIFSTTIQAYKINSILIPKNPHKDENNNDENINNLINFFAEEYLNNNIKLNEINNLITGLEISDQISTLLKEKAFDSKLDHFATNKDGSVSSGIKEVTVFIETLIGKLLENDDYLKEDSYKKGISFLKNKVLEERKIRLKNFVKSGWYVKGDDLSFGKEISEILKNEFSNKNFELIKNKKSEENIKCVNKKCFFKKDNIVNDKNIIFYDDNNFYIIEIEDMISNINEQKTAEKDILKIEEISEVILKSNYDKYKKKTLEYLIKDQKNSLNFKKKEICAFFKSQYPDLFFGKKIKCL